MVPSGATIRPPFRSEVKHYHYEKKVPNYESERFFATSQLAKRWGVSQATVIRLIERKELKGLKIGNHFRISLSSIRKYENKVSF